MNAYGLDYIKILEALFPESDSTVLSALASHGDVIARYIAQLHDLTLAETIEAIEAFTGTSLQAPAAVLAAE